MENDIAYPGLLVWAAGLSLAAGVAHFVVMPEYLSEWWGYGCFFMFAALAQLTYGLLLFMRPWAYAEDGDSRRRPEAIARPIYQAGAAGNLAIIGLYLITRTAGIPLFGPGAGRVEPLTALSLAVTVTEAVLAWILLGLARREESGMTQAAAGARPDSRQEI